MNKKRLLIIGLIVILVLLIGNSLLARLNAPQPKTTIETIPTPASESFHSLVPGNNIPSELTRSNGFVLETEENGRQVAQFRSANPLINDEVISENGKVKMKKTIAKDSTGKNPTIEQYFRSNGEAEIVTTDADFGTEVFAWPSKGIAAAGSRELDELFRTYSFEPMSIDQFKTEFASEFRFTIERNELGY